MKTLIKSTAITLHYVTGYRDVVCIKDVPKYHRLGNCFTGIKLGKHGALHYQQNCRLIVPPIVATSFNLKRSYFA